jgi:hypothetical protein
MARAPGLERHLANRFEWPDANGDGALTRGEVAAAAADRFGRSAADGEPTRQAIASGMRQGG